MTPLFGKRKQAQLAEAENFRRLKRLAGEDVQALGAELAEAAPDSAGHHSAATTEHAAARAALAAAENAEQVAAAEAQLVESRWQLAAARAAAAGTEPPARGPECSFNPQHGPADQRLTWTPGIGEAREVDVCAACSAHLAAGQEPDHRQVRVGDRYVAWWQLAEVFENEDPVTLGNVSDRLDGLHGHVTPRSSTRESDAAMLEASQRSGQAVRGYGPTGG